MTPLRTCVACRRRLPQAQLRRFRAGPGAVVDGPGHGRSAYVCRHERCERIAFGRGAIGRMLGLREAAGRRSRGSECGD
jgi:predicted RNA-binding protein YlxR (DUF448 family)